jgi:catechol 2,3-dioxygenase-like lactoylglutathione lyase family enzyme
MNNILKRTTLIVRDAGRSLAFYRDVFGMTVWYDDEIVLGGVTLPVGSRGDRTRLVIMRAQDPVIGMIGLLQFTAPPLPAPTSERATLGIGDVVFVMQTDDVEAVHERLRAWGARIQAPPHDFEVRGADGAQLRMTTLSCWDPDGYFFEINQRHAA